MPRRESNCSPNYSAWREGVDCIVEIVACMIGCALMVGTVAAIGYGLHWIWKYVLGQ